MKHFIVLNSETETGAFIESENIESLRAILLDNSYTSIIEVDDFNFDMYEEYQVFGVSIDEFLKA